MDSTAQAHEHNFPERAGEYVKIGLILFVLTAHGSRRLRDRPPEGVPLHDFMHTALIPVLIVLSAIKFALVALFYMHLKWDGPLLKGIFSFSLFLATFVILALLALFIYEGKFSALIGPAGEDGAGREAQGTQAGKKGAGCTPRSSSFHLPPASCRLTPLQPPGRPASPPPPGMPIPPGSTRRRSA